MLKARIKKWARVLAVVLMSFCLTLTGIGMAQDEEETKMRWAVEQKYLKSRTLGVEEAPVVELALFGDRFITSKQLDKLEELGFKITGQALNLVQVKGSIADAGKLEKLDFIKEISFPLKWRHNEGEVSLDDNLTCCGVDQVHGQGYTGQGVTIAVIDTGFTGELKEEWKGRVKYRKAVYEKEQYSFTQGRLEGIHGTSAARTVGTIAPESRLYLISVPDFPSGLVALQKAPELGVDVISLSIGLPVPLDHGDCSSRYNQVFKNLAKKTGSLVSVSAGNFATNHYLGNYSDPDGNSYHNFSNTGDVFDDNTLRVQLPGGRCMQTVLEWNDWDTDQKKFQDLDLEFYDREHHGLFAVDTPQCGGDKMPLEYTIPNPICLPEGVGFRTFYIAIRNVTSEECGRKTRPVELSLWTEEGKWEKDTIVSKRSIRNFANCKEILTVGGSRLEKEDTLNCEYKGYLPSSQGPTFEGRTKPDVVAPTCYFDPTQDGLFCGTSASAPFAAGAAALILEANNDNSSGLGGLFTPAEITSILKSTAIDRGPPEEDPQTGWGLIDVDSAVKEAIERTE